MTACKQATIARMRLASIVLPLTDNDGKPIDEAHEYLEAELLSRFGGFSSNRITGAWMDDDGKIYRDVSVKYEVAMFDTYGNRMLIEELAYALVSKAKQECIMATLPDGSVSFIHANQYPVAVACNDNVKKEVA